MSLHKCPEHNTPEVVRAMKAHGMDTDNPSQLSDAFRLGFAAAHPDWNPAIGGARETKKRISELSAAAAVIIDHVKLATLDGETLGPDGRLFYDVGLMPFLTRLATLGGRHETGGD